MSGDTTLKNPIAPNAKLGHVTNLSNFVRAKVTIMNCNSQQTTTLLTSSCQKYGNVAAFFSKLSFNVNMDRNQFRAEILVAHMQCIFLTGEVEMF